MVLIIEENIKQFESLVEKVDEPLEKTFQNMHNGYQRETLERFLKARDGNVSNTYKMEKLEFKHMLQIALGAGKGDPLQTSLTHLHSLSLRLIHKDFKTANVLVDENFIAKVVDAGLRNFLGRFDYAATTSQVVADECFLAPKVSEFRRFSYKSDVYSFGVFLLELVSGLEARELLSSDVNQNLVEYQYESAGGRFEFLA